nr:PTS sugar transporter subunit IIA [uncultured Caproiciproducens sp.]
MKNREKNILNFILENSRVTLAELLSHFSISKRTLYYDVEKINSQIKGCGQIKNIAQEFSYIGNCEALKKMISGAGSVDMFTSGSRQDYILEKILTGQTFTLESLAEELSISKNTCISDMDAVKTTLRSKGLRLQAKPSYAILGNEIDIRELYLILLQENASLIERISPAIVAFDHSSNLQLTDYSLGSLSAFLEFLKMRMAKEHFVKSSPYLTEAQEFPFYSSVALLIGQENEPEKMYLSAYIASLPSLNHNVDDSLIERYVNRIIEKFEVKTAITLESKDEFKRNIKRHLLSSYYRIKFHFPISNLGLTETKVQQGALYRIIKSILTEIDGDFPEFHGMRDEEIGFITAYFGGYLAGSRDSGVRKNKVLLVCPNGLMISKNLGIQLYRYIPAVEVVDTIAISRLADYTGYYDYIISTVELPAYENVIVVNPFLTKLDIQRIMNKLLDFSGFTYSFDVELLMQVIRKNADIVNENQLYHDLEALIYPKKEQNKEVKNPMLKDLIYDERVNVVQHVDKWQDAIAIAAKPLIEDHSIESAYVDAMIASVNQFGPYIVLDDYFALPHAMAKVGVNRVAMSLLVVKDEVDLMGQPVNVFLVLATVDSTSHLDALANLSDILCERENLRTFRTGNKKEIISLINRY